MLWTRSIRAVACVLVLAACGSEPPTEPAVSFDEPAALLTQLQDLAASLQNRTPTLEERAEAHRILERIGQWNRQNPERTVETSAGPASGHLVATTATSGGYWGGTGSVCTPCPFIIFHNGRIGILRSEGPCRPGAGLERCFYTWVGGGLG